MPDFIRTSHVGVFFSDYEEGYRYHAICKAAGKTCRVRNPDKHFSSEERRRNGKQSYQSQSRDRGFEFFMKLCKNVRNHMRFAHGKHELISKTQGANYKKERCKSFYEKGYCPYGSRCQFQHDERKLKDINISFFYLQLFLFKYFGFRKNNRYFFEKNTSLHKRRLPVFESLTHLSEETKNIFSQNDNDKYIFCYNLNDGNSLSSKSRKSNDDTTSNSNNFLPKEIYDDINDLSNGSN